MDEKKARRTAAEVAELRAAELEAVEAAAAVRVAQARERAARAKARAEAAEAGTEKRADDRVKVLVGACVGHALSRGWPVSWGDPADLLQELDRFLVRPRERLAVLGELGEGSAAFWRVCRAFGEDQGAVEPAGAVEGDQATVEPAGAVEGDQATVEPAGAVEGDQEGSLRSGGLGGRAAGAFRFFNKKRKKER